MTDILCNWLNHELRLSVKIDPTNFAREFATGYLIGEVLEKHALLTDFEFYSQSKTADSKLNNFTRMEPVLHLLGVRFDTNTARDIMTEKSGTATRVLYQLFIALNKKEKAKLTGVAMDTMRPSAPAKLEGVESIMYKERLKHLTPRQTDLNLQALVARFHEKQINLEETAFRERFNEEQRREEMLQQKREQLISTYKDTVAKRSEMLAKIQAATVDIPRTPPSKTARAIQMRRQMRREQEAEDTRRELAAFDDRLKRTLPPSKPLGEDDAAAAAREVAALPESLEVLRPGDNSEYINKIRRTLQEDAQARLEREKRRRKVLVDQLRAHEAQEEAKREEMLVNRLMRQSQQERRIAVQLLQTRHEKEVIRRNRLAREKQYVSRRLKEFEEAMNKEKELARLTRLDYEEQARLDREQHDRLMAERAEQRYRKHYAECAEVLASMLDFVGKVTEYRELTNNLVPQKLYREWKALFEEGKPIYEVAEVPLADEPEPTPEQILEEERQELLDEGDFSEYRQMIGEWVPPEEAEPKIEGPPKNNPIVGHIVQRLFDIVHPPTSPPPPPEFPPFPIKACVLGKTFAGKSSALKKLTEYHRLEILRVEKLVQEAIEAHNNNEMTEVVEEVAETPLMSTEPTIIDDNRTGEITIPPPATEGEESKGAKGHEAADDGAEKSDPEKPVPAEEKSLTADEGTTKEAEAKETVQGTPASKAGPSGSSKSSKQSKVKTGKKEEPVRALSPPKPQPTTRNKLGGKALKLLKKGRACDDQLLVDIMVDAIKRVPEGTGWVLDGFPATNLQAKQLEKALTGGEGMGREDSKLSVKDTKKTGAKKSKLAPDPRPAAPAPEPGSGINVVVLFDISNELVLKRAAGRTHSIQTGEQYHAEFKPPPEGTTTGLGDDQVLPVEDPSHEQEQIQHRLNAFNEAWPRMEKWFNKFGSLVRVDASLEEESAFLELEKILEDSIKKLEGEALEEAVMAEAARQAAEEQARLEAQKPPEPEPVPEPAPVEEERASRPASKKSGSRGGSAKRSGSRGSKDDKKDKTRAASKSDSKSKASRDSSAKSPKGKKGSGQKAKTPTPEPEPEPKVRPGTPPPEPGSDEWVYVDEPIDPELARVLAPYWEEIESNYVNSSKVVFRKLRQERERIIRYLYQIRKDYMAYLRRPDTKQEFVTQWQKDFNEVADDIRDDEETRAELHQRVDDLRETLWTICDERKEQAEKERGSVQGEGWLEDHLGLLSNHYITVMQTELDRFQDSLRLLKDYYRGMEGKIPDEASNDCARIPLIDLPPTVDPNDPQPEEVETPKSPAADENKSTASKSGIGKKSKGSQEDIQEKKKIPLVPRRPVSPDPNAPAAKGKDAKGKKPNAKEEELPPPPSDPDEKLIYDAHCNGIISVDKLCRAVIAKVQQEQAAREAEEAAEREREALKEAEKQKAAAAAAKGKGKDKKGGKKSAKSRSPSPKKRGDKSPSATTPQPEEQVESEEEKERKLQLQRARQEFFHALQQEAEAAKVRMSLVKLVATHMLQALKTDSEGAYKDMHDWLGARFLKEMESIDQLSEVMRHAVENGTKIREELVLKQEEFLINQDTKTLKTPSPEARPDPTEAVKPDYFTVEQIINIYQQFALTAPTGVLSLTAFEETFRSLTALTHGTEQIPDMWLSLTGDKLEQISAALSADGEYIDWRAFLLAAAQPWPAPTQSELLATLERLAVMDQKQTGFVTREQFERVELWFHGWLKPQTPADPSAPYPYDRLANLNQAFFEIFADHNMDPSQLDYKRMLMYFAGCPHPYAGLLRALSVVVGEHMPHNPIKMPRQTSRPASQASLLESVVREGTADEFDMLPVEEIIPDSALQARVPLNALEKVLQFGQKMRGDSHRFSVQVDPEDLLSKERLEGIYQELGCDASNPAPFTLLIEHPIIQDIMASCNAFKTIDLKSLLTNTATGEQLELQSQKTD